MESHSKGSLSDLSGDFCNKTEGKRDSQVTNTQSSSENKIYPIWDTIKATLKGKHTPLKDLWEKQKD